MLPENLEGVVDDGDVLRVEMPNADVFVVMDDYAAGLSGDVCTQRHGGQGREYQRVQHKGNLEQVRR